MFEESVKLCSGPVGVATRPSILVRTPFDSVVWPVRLLRRAVLYRQAPKFFCRKTLGSTSRLHHFISWFSTAIPQHNVAYSY